MEELQSVYQEMKDCCKKMKSYIELMEEAHDESLKDEPEPSEYIECPHCTAFNRLESVFALCHHCGKVLLPIIYYETSFKKKQGMGFRDFLNQLPEDTLHLTLKEMKDFFEGVAVTPYETELQDYVRCSLQHCGCPCQKIVPTEDLMPCLIDEEPKVYSNTDELVNDLAQKFPLSVVSTFRDDEPVDHFKNDEIYKLMKYEIELREKLLNEGKDVQGIPYGTSVNFFIEVEKLIYGSIQKVYRIRPVPT